jgi:hypothetical protein
MLGGQSPSRLTRAILYGHYVLAHSSLEFHCYCLETSISDRPYKQQFQCLTVSSKYMAKYGGIMCHSEPVEMLKY